MSIEDLFISSTFPAIHDLGKLPVVAQQLHNICDVQLVGEEEYYRYSPSLCVSWLKTRVERASKIVKDHSLIAALRLISSYISTELLQAICSEYSLEPSQLEPKPEQTQSESKASVKRRHSGKSASQAKKGKSSVSITSFFKVK